MLGKESPTSCSADRDRKAWAWLLADPHES